MERKNDYLFSILVVISTATIFFIMGFTASSIFGTKHTLVTEIEYVEPEDMEAYIREHYGSLDSLTGSVEKFDLNTVTEEQLMTIPGIGKSYATRILEYRELIGGFTQVEQLAEVEGVGEKRYAQWAIYFTVSEPQTDEEP